MRSFLKYMGLFLLVSTASCHHGNTPDWTVSSLPYRILVEVPSVDIGKRSSDALPASVELDFSASPFASLSLNGQVDLETLQVIRYDPATGKPLPSPLWPFSRSQGERASRFLDKSLPWDFPLPGGPPNPSAPRQTFPRGGYLTNVKGEGESGLLVWDHLQEGKDSAQYAIYFDTLKPGQRQKPPRQGFIGDGSPRRDLEAPSLTGSFYNRVTVDDWDGDGLPDFLIGEGFGHVLLFRNQGDSNHAEFGQGEYLKDSTGSILGVGGMASPRVVDWNGDNALDLLVGAEGSQSLFWYENAGSNADRKLVFRGAVQTDGRDLLLPAKPCPESPHYQRDYAPSVEAVDWDDDGDVDLLLGGYITGYIWLYENVGKRPDGSPALAFRGPLQADGKPIDTIWGAHPCAVDLDSDGDLDLLSGSFGQAMGGGDFFSRFLVYYENIGTRQKPRFTERPVSYEGNAPRDILAQPRAVDFNHDGLTDLVISTMAHVYLAQNVGTKTAPKWKVDLQRAPWGLSAYSATQLLDWNGDGQLDLISSPLDSSNEPQILLNQGKGTQGVFGPPQPLLPAGGKITHPAPYGDPWAFVYLYDFDGDGDLDLLWADGPGYAYLHRNRGTSQNPNFEVQGQKLLDSGGRPIKVGPPFVPREKISNFTEMQGSRAGIAAGDFNGDGRTDIVLGDTFGKVYFFQNVGTPEKPIFAAALIVGDVKNRAIPLAYDWDRDGLLDLVAVSEGRQQNLWSWFRNLGGSANPPFATAQPLNLPPTVHYANKLLIADWNGDGDDDFLIQSQYPWFCWLEASYVKHGYAQGRIVSVEAKK